MTAEWSEYETRESHPWSQPQASAHEDFDWGYLRCTVTVYPAERTGPRWRVEVEINRSSKEAFDTGTFETGYPRGRIEWAVWEDSKEVALRKARELFDAVRAVALTLDVPLVRSDSAPPPRRRDEPVARKRRGRAAST